MEYPTYRTGYLGRGYTVHVLRLAAPDPFYRSLCRPRWSGGIMTLSGPIAPEDKAGELSFVTCSRCHAAFEKTPVLA